MLGRCIRTISETAWLELTQRPTGQGDEEMKKIDAVINLYREAVNIHREYLAGQNGGCPCTGNTLEACPLGTAISDLEEAYGEALDK